MQISNAGWQCTQICRFLFKFFAYYNSLLAFSWPSPTTSSILTYIQTISPFLFEQSICRPSYRTSIWYHSAASNLCPSGPIVHLTKSLCIHHWACISKPDHQGCSTDGIRVLDSSHRNSSCQGGVSMACSYGVAHYGIIRSWCAHYGVTLSVFIISLPRICARVLWVRLNAEPPMIVKQFDVLWRDYHLHGWQRDVFIT